MYRARAKISDEFQRIIYISINDSHMSDHAKSPVDVQRFRDDDGEK